jgi:hypothetical protein
MPSSVMQAIIGPAEEEGDADSGISPARYFFLNGQTGGLPNILLLIKCWSTNRPKGGKGITQGSIK